MGQGTGLGLSTCYGIVKQSGGHISVYSEPARGTTFKIYLPGDGAAGAGRGAAAGIGRRLPRGTETMLLVEDDPALREMATTLLGRLGYRVLAAANGLEALSLQQQPGIGHIDVLFTDVVMPHMSGTELADARAGTSTAHEGAVHVRLHRARRRAPGVLSERRRPAAEAVHAGRPGENAARRARHGAPIAPLSASRCPGLYWSRMSVSPGPAPLEFGLDTFGDVTLGADGTPLPQAQVLRDVVEEAVLADQVGLDFFGVGEHHRDDFAISAPEVVLAAIAGAHRAHPPRLGRHGAQHRRSGARLPALLDAQRRSRTAAPR